MDYKTSKQDESFSFTRQHISYCNMMCDDMLSLSWSIDLEGRGMCTEHGAGSLAILRRENFWR